jgi:hypothetical protein
VCFCPFRILFNRGGGGGWRAPRKGLTRFVEVAVTLTGNGEWPVSTRVNWGKNWRGAVPLWARDLRDREMTPLPLRLCWSVRLFQSLSRSTSLVGFLVEDGSGVTRGLGISHARSLLVGHVVGLSHKRPSWLSIIDWSNKYYHSITVIITINL